MALETIYHKKGNNYAMRKIIDRLNAAKANMVSKIELIEYCQGQIQDTRPGPKRRAKRVKT